MRIENKKVYIEKEHDNPNFSGTYLYEVNEPVCYVFNENGLLEFVRKIASDLLDSYLSEIYTGKQKYLDSIKLD